ncbi:MAG: DUF6785 family protein, partial [Candidatus Poribacteria bacterium]
MDQKLIYKSVSLRAICISVVLIIPNVYFLINNHIYLSGLPTTISLFYNVIITLSIIVLINIFISKFAKYRALTQGELLTIYAMLAVGSAVSGHDMLQTVVPALTHGYWYATPENEWQSLFWHFLPKWLMVQDPTKLAEYYQGESSLYWGDHYTLWITPIIWWTTFFVALTAVMIAINIMIKVSWTIHERLTFPIVRLPYDLTKQSSEFLRSKLMWIGFSVAGGIALWNGIHALFPAFPQIPTRQFEIS